MRKLLREAAIYLGFVVLIGVTFAVGVVADSWLERLFPWSAP